MTALKADELDDRRVFRPRGRLTMGAFCSSPPVTACVRSALVKRLTYGHSRVHIGDRTADLLLEYLSLLTRARKVDVVPLTALTEDGGALPFRFILDPEVPVLIEESDDQRTEPDNRPSELHMREQIARLSSTSDRLGDGWR
jgi:hypothetical protein